MYPKELWLIGIHLHKITPINVPQQERKHMAPKYNEIKDLLRHKADLNTRLNLLPYDGTPEIKERNNKKYLYIRKRIAGKHTSTYVG